MRDMFLLPLAPSHLIEGLGWSLADSCALTALLDAQVASLNWLYCPARASCVAARPLAAQLAALQRLVKRSSEFAKRLDFGADLDWKSLLPTWLEPCNNTPQLSAENVDVLSTAACIDPLPLVSEPLRNLLADKEGVFSNDLTPMEAASGVGRDVA